MERLIELFGLSNAFWKIATTSLYAIIAMLVVFALIEHLNVPCASTDVDLYVFFLWSYSASRDSTG